jgi:MFS family permease
MLGGCYALASPLRGYLVDRFGARAVVLPLRILLGVVIASIAWLPGTKWAIYGVFALIGLLAPGQVPVGKIIAQWFGRRRGAAFSVLGIGVTMAIPLGLQFARWLIDSYGWRSAFIVYGALQWVIALPPLFFLFRPPPGLSGGAGIGTSRSGAHAHEPGVSPRCAWSSAAFWLIAGNLFVFVLLLAAFLTHGIAILTERGLSREVATAVLSAFTLGTIASQPLLGMLLDRFDTPRIILPFAIAALIGVVLFQSVQGLAALAVASVIMGLGGGESGTTQYLISRYFGLRYFSVIYGSIQPCVGIAAAVGPLAMGVLYDRTGSYRMGLMALAVAVFSAVLLLASLKPYVFSTTHVQASEVS